MNAERPECNHHDQRYVCVHCSEQLRKAAFEEGRKAVLSEEKCKACGCSYESCCCNPMREMKAFEEGQREMREKVFSLPIAMVPDDMDIKDPRHAWINGYEDAILACRALFLTTRGGDNKPPCCEIIHDVMYSGQCNHQIPFGQPCAECGR